ncbi:hypothetical protein FBU30_011164 [Linnemannia zychae]|nr:hypothetical protein FBU30_011164 [Linnemannia zychae]
MLTLHACAATTTGSSFPPGGGPVGLSNQAPSFSNSSSQFQSRHSFRPNPSTTASNNSTLCRKRAFPHDEANSDLIHSNHQNHDLSSSDSQSTASSAAETPIQCPRLQTQLQLCLPRKSSQPIATLQGLGGIPAQCPLDPSTAKANFVDSLVDTAAIVIESIWPPLPGSESSQKQKGLPLRTFIQETLKRSRSSYSTLQTALFYLYKIRNKVPCAYLKRRQNQLYAQQTLSLPHSAVGLVTPPASPYHQQNLAEFPVNVQGADYFSVRKMDSKPSLPSPLSSNCSMASASPASVSGYSPCSSASPASTTSSPDSSSASPYPSSTPVSGTSGSTQSGSSSTSSSQSNRIIYCGRRTFLAALMVASKYLQDRNYSNKAWAKISGLSIKEINANELIFLKLIDYSLFVSHETFMRWTALLVAHGPEATRKFMQTADAVHANAFAARVMSASPMVLNGSHIRYATTHKIDSGVVSVPSPASSVSEDDSAESCEADRASLESTVSRTTKMARMNTYISSGVHA